MNKPNNPTINKSDQLQEYRRFGPERQVADQKVSRGENASQSFHTDDRNSEPDNSPNSQTQIQRRASKKIWLTLVVALGLV